MKLSRIFVVFGISVLFLLSACYDSSDNTPLYIDHGAIYNAYPLDQVQNDFEYELYANFIWLDLLYFYGHSRNEIGDNYRIYLGKGTEDVNNIKGLCTANYYDICYMFNQMADPFTRYYDPNVANAVYKRLMETEEVVGIGADVEVVVTDSASSHLVITQIYPNSPSEKAGLQVGDTILSIDDLPIATQEHFKKLCSGDKGSTIQVTVKRDEETLTLDVVLEEYHAPSVKIHYEDSIPVIEILEFSSKTIHKDGTYGEFLEALEKTEGAKSTIIDVRKNPGGDVEQCNNVSAELLAAGDTIITDIMADFDSVLDKGRYKFVQFFDTITYTATHDGLGKDRYYVLMASDTSASCAEVFLSAVSVNKKTPIVGITSYGKAIGQAVITEEDYINGIALITALQGIDKNGDSYHDVGIVPDYEITDPDEQMKKAVELAKKAKELRTAGYGTKKLHHFSKARESTTSRNPIPDIQDLKTRYKVFSK